MNEKELPIKYRDKVSESFSEHVIEKLHIEPREISAVLNSQFYPDDKTLSFFANFVYVLGKKKDSLHKKNEKGEVDIEAKEKAILESWNTATTGIIEHHKTKVSKKLEGKKLDKRVVPKCSDTEKYKEFQENIALVHDHSEIEHQDESVKEISEWCSLLQKNWVILAWVSNPDDKYFGAAFWNAEMRQVIISHRGTCVTWVDRDTIIADIKGVARLEDTEQIHSACTFSALVLEKLKNKPVSISFTGHSLGAWLAQITTFASEYLELVEHEKPIEENKEESSAKAKFSRIFKFKKYNKPEKKKFRFRKKAPHKTGVGDSAEIDSVEVDAENDSVEVDGAKIDSTEGDGTENDSVEVDVSSDSWSHAHTVVFDSPGCYEKLCQISEYSGYDRYKIEAHYLIAALDITIYVNRPNCINCVYSHKAVSRIFQIYETNRLDEDFIHTVPKNLSFFNIDTHGIINFISMFFLPQKTRILSVYDWPSYSLPRKNTCLPKKEEKKKKPKKVGFFRHPYQLTSITVDLIKIAGIEDSNELKQFLKELKCENIWFDVQAGEPNINYQAKDVNRNLRSASIFTKKEKTFLECWNTSRNEFSKLKSLKDFLHQNSIGFLLKYNWQENYKNNCQENYDFFLPKFEFREEFNKKIFECSGKEDVSRVINTTKHLLLLFPKICEEIEKDENDLKIATAELLRDRSDNYVKTLPQWSLIDFVGNEDLANFLQSSLGSNTRETETLQTSTTDRAAAEREGNSNHLEPITESNKTVLILTTYRETSEQMFIIRNILQRSKKIARYLRLTDLIELNDKKDMAKAFKDKACTENNILVIDSGNIPAVRYPFSLLNEFILIAKTERDFPKKLIIVIKREEMENGIEKENVKPATFQFTDLANDSQISLREKIVFGLCDKDINLDVLFSKANPENTSERKIDLEYTNLLKDDVLLSLIETSDPIQMNSEFINNDILKVLTYEVCDKFKMLKRPHFAEKDESFTKSVLLITSKDETNINILDELICKAQTSISFGSGQNETYMITLHDGQENAEKENLALFHKKCRDNAEKRIYWLCFSFKEVELQRIYDDTFYITRHIRHEVLFKNDGLLEVIKNKPSNLFIVRDNEKKNFSNIMLETSKDSIFGNQSVIVEKDMETAVKSFRKAEDIQGRSVHLVKVEDKTLQWIRSKGSIKDIYDHVYIGDSTLTDTKCFGDEKGAALQYSDTKAVVIADESGMGKSTLLLKLAKEMTDHWIIKVDLLNIREKILQISIEPNELIGIDAIIELLCLSTSNLSTPFTKAILKHSLTHETFVPVVLFFDGFDEITNKNARSRLVSIFKYIKENTSSSVRMFITTKLWAKKYLEESLLTFAMRIKEIEDEDQKNFIKKFWLSRLSLEKKIDGEFEKQLDIVIADLFKRKDLFVPISSHVQISLRNELERKIETLNQDDVTSILFLDMFNDFHRFQEKGVFVEKKLRLYFEEKKIINYKLLDIAVFACSLNRSENLFCQRYLKNHFRNESTVEQSKIESVKKMLIASLSKMEGSSSSSMQVLPSNDVLGIPLQLRMFAAILPIFSDINSFKFPETLSELYWKFILLKFNIYEKEKLKKSRVRRDQIKPFLDIYNCLAFQLLFPHEVVNHLTKNEIVDFKDGSLTDELVIDVDVNNEDKSTFEKNLRREMIVDIMNNRVGILEVSLSKDYRFIDNSVAEYFATKKILDLLKAGSLQDSLLKDILLKNEFKMMRQFLNDQLAVDEDYIKILKFFSEKVCKRFSSIGFYLINEKGESCLHICVSENLVKLATLLLNSFNESEEKLQLFLDIINGDHETATHYAAFNNQQELAKLLISFKPKENIMNFTAKQWREFDNLVPEECLDSDDVIVSFGKHSISLFFRKHNEIKKCAAYMANSLESHQILELIKKYGNINGLSVSSIETLSLFARRINAFGYIHEILLKSTPALEIYRMDEENLMGHPISGNLLYLAASKGEFKIVYRLLNENASTDVVDIDNNETPLLAAAREGHWDIVCELINRNANVNIVDKNCASVLLYAANSNKSSIVQELLRKKAKMNFVEKKGKYTAIGLAASKKYWTIVETLIIHGADVNIKLGDHKVTVLHYAANAGKVEIVLKLLEKNADINAIETENNFTPLTTAANEKQWDVVRALIKRGANVDIPAGEGKVTLLQLAIEHEQADIAFEVMQKTKKIDGDSESTVNAPIIIAAIKKHWRIVSKLINLGADIHKRHRETGYTLLHIAAMDGQLGMVKRLLSMKVNKDLTGYVDNATPMLLAAHYNHWDTVLELIDNDADTNIPDKSYHSVLHLAAKKNSLLIVKKLLKKGADKDAKSIHHMTPICLAAVHYNWEIVLELLNAGANPNIAVAVGNKTVLFVAAVQGQLNVVEKLLGKEGLEKDVVETENNLTALFAAALRLQWDIVLKLINAGANVNIPNKNNETVLHVAVSNGQLNIVKELIKAKAMIDLYNKEAKATPLGIAASHKYWDIVKELVVAGADIKIKLGSYDSTVLHYAASAGETDLVELLLNKRADINSTETENGYTPLLIAAKNQRWDTVKLLIDHGADLNIATTSDKDGGQVFTALHFAAYYNGLDAVRALLLSDRIAIGECENKFSVTAATLAAKRNYWNIVSALIEGGANVSKPAKNSKMTVLHLAAEENKLDIVKQLFRRSNEININAREASQNMTALFIAAVKDHWEIVKYLVDNDADPNIPNLGFRTVLYLAAEKGNFEIVELLLEKHGMIIDSVESVKKATPIYIAALKGHWQIVQKLIEKGANLNIYYGSNQISVLHLASSSGDLDTVKALLRKGVDVNFTEKNDDVTPIYAAGLNNHWNVVLELINAGARVNIPTKKDQKTVYDLAVEQLREDFLDEVEKRHLDIFYT